MNTTKKAYLLIECALVLALIAFLVGLGLHLTSALQRIPLRTDAEKISAFLRASWLKAMSEHTFITIQVDVKNNKLRLHDTPDISLSSGVIFGVLKHALGPPSRPHKQLDKASSFIDDQIIFYPDGTVTAGALYLVDVHKTRMYAVTIPLPDIFHVHVYVLKGRAWKRL